MTVPTLTEKRERLLSVVRGYGSCLVALSAGVDSTVVAQAAQLALGDRAVAVTGVSQSLAAGELDEAVALARRIGIRHEVLATEEFDNPLYLQNAPNRCYFCKTELYSQLDAVAARLGLAVIANGANLDDQGDYRPGMQAAAEHEVKSPLIEAGLDKADVRALASDWGLPIWDKPATPCLSSRVAYGEEVTPARLARIDAAERFLRSQGVRVVRVRLHKGELARIELPAEELPRLADAEFRATLVARMRELGFRFVTLDLEGFRSGSLNAALVPLETPTASRATER